MNHISVTDKWEQKRLRHRHQHPPLINVNQVLVETLTPGQRVADRLAIVMGSWTFMIVQSIILATTSARPVTTIKKLDSSVPERPAASAKGIRSIHQTCQ
jgi:hypothetical protein